MAAPVYTASLTTALTVQGLGVGEQSYTPVAWMSSTSPALRIDMPLQVGDNIIVPPQPPFPTAQVMVMFLPTGTILTFKGASGDTGYVLGSPINGELRIALGSTLGAGGFLGSFILNSTVQVVATTYFL